MNSNNPFIGRKKELQYLNDLLKKRMASLVVIRGRRRIGKSRLIEEFAKGKRFLQFSGLPPTKNITAQDQRNEFLRLLSEQTNLPEIKTDDWGKIFSLLHEKIKEGRVIVLLDEISWMAHDDPTFLGKLKNAWDLHFKKNQHLIFILCGSVSSWIENNILSSTAFFGRISEKITLPELPLQNCNELLINLGFNRSPMEKLILLSLTSGIPWYIEQVNPSYSAADNIKHWCFEPDGILVNEYQHIFHELFGKRSIIYERITSHLAKKNYEYGEIASGVDYSASGALSDYLNDLITSGYISKDSPWNFASGKDYDISLYRLTDNYLRFYYRYIQPKLTKITQGEYDNINLTTLPSWSTIMGLQFENLVLKNRKLVQEILRIHPEDIVANNPYYQRATKRYPGCQIDYLIQTRYKTLFVCEIKFTTSKLDTSIIKDVEQKIKRFKIPRGYSCVPVLIHCGEITEELLDANYFFQCINFCDFLKDG